jgi:pimeloyl-ACP methyl ester carboxylesterase
MLFRFLIAGLVPAALSIAGLASPAAAQAARGDSARFAAPATGFINAVKGADFAAAAAMASPAAPAGAFTAKSIEDLWRTLNTQVGALQSFRFMAVQTLDAAHAVDFDAAFDRARLTMRVVLDDSAKVRGFGFLPAAAPTSTPPPAYADTSVFAEDTLTFGAEGWKLTATLSLPKGSARVPVVILVHGSGPNDRDETIGPNKPFRDIAMGLASKGIAVLRYDKRTFLHSSRMTSVPVTLDNEVIDDALLAIAEMRRHPRIDSSRVYIFGHSLGGMLAPEISSRDGRLAGIILGAAPARPFAIVLSEQLAYLDTLARASGDTANATLRTARAKMDTLRSGRLHDTVSVLGVPASYWYSLDSLNAVQVVKEQRSRVLVLQGGRDYQVTMEDYRMWQAALTGTGKGTFHAYPTLNHIFLEGRGRATPSEYQLMSGSVSAELVRHIAEWIRPG